MNGEKIEKREEDSSSQKKEILFLVKLKIRHKNDASLCFGCSKGRELLRPITSRKKDVISAARVQ